MRHSIGNAEKTFFEGRKLISLCSLWIYSADKAFIELKSSCRLQRELKKKKALQLIKAIVNYMKEIISLLWLHERVMIGLDRFPSLYVAIGIDWLFSSVKDCAQILWILVDVIPGHRSWWWWPIQSTGTVKAKIIWDKVKQIRKTLFKTIAIGEGDQNAVWNELCWRRGRRVFKHWAFLSEKNTEGVLG